MSLVENQDKEEEPGGLSGYMTKALATGFGDTLPITTAMQKSKFGGLTGAEKQHDKNLAAAAAAEKYDPTMFMENWARPGMSADAGTAKLKSSISGIQGAEMDNAIRSKSFENNMADFAQRLQGESMMADEVNALSNMLIAQGQSGRDLHFGLQNINASLYAQQLANQLAMAGIPLDMIGGLLGNLGLGNILGGITDPITEALG